MKKSTGKARPISHEIDGGGWVKLWRKTLDSDVFADPNLWHLFSWCLLSASHTAHHVQAKTGRGGTVATIGRGQFIFGRNSAARELRLEPSTVYRRMKRLERMETLTIQPDSHFSIVTVCNWDRYQGGGGKSGHPTGHPKDTQRTRKGQAKNTYKKGEKAQKGENGEKTKDDDDDSSSSWKNARALAKEFENAGTFNLRNGGKPRATESQRRDVLRACKLAVEGGIERAWLQEAATSTRDSKPEKNAYGYFLKLVRDICANHGVAFGKAAAFLEVPQELRRPNDRPGAQDAGDAADQAGANQPAHQDRAPCVPEGRDDPQDLPNGSGNQGRFRGPGGVTG